MEAVDRVIPEPVRRRAFGSVGVPTAAMVLLARAIFVTCPFPHVTMHVVHSQRIGEVVPYGTGSFKVWAFYAGTCWNVAAEIGLCERQIVAGKSRQVCLAAGKVKVVSTFGF